MVMRELFVRCLTCVAALALLGCGTSSVNSDSHKPGYLLARHGVPATHRETEDVAIAIDGKAPDIVFKFWDCKFQRPRNGISSINVAGNSQTVCRAELVDEYQSIPSVWKYGEAGDGYEIVRCKPLVPGEYGITVYGGERGRAEFHVSDDGTVTITKGLTCDSMPAEWKEPNSE